MVTDAMLDAANWLIEQLAFLADGVIWLLPSSPFSALTMMFDSELLGYINYFLPVAEAVNLLVAWGAAILLWYAYMWILRWIKVAAG